MRLRDELLRGAVDQALDARDHGSRDDFTAAVAEVVRVHRVAPLIEAADRLAVAVDAQPAMDAAVAERTQLLEALLIEARRDATLAWARVAALEVTVGG